MSWGHSASTPQAPLLAPQQMAPMAQGGQAPYGQYAPRVELPTKYLTPAEMNEEYMNEQIELYEMTEFIAA